MIIEIKLLYTILNPWNFSLLEIMLLCIVLREYLILNKTNKSFNTSCLCSKIKIKFTNFEIGTCTGDPRRGWAEFCIG